VATKKQRQRQLARQAHQRRIERQADRAKRSRMWAAGGTTAVVVIGVALLAAVLAGAFSPAKAKPSAGASASASPSVTASPTPTPSPTNTAAMVDGNCVYLKAGVAARKVSLPPAKPDTKASYTATIKTNRGDIVIDMLNSKAPCTVNSFVSLADQKYYNNTHCHRLTTSGIYVLQCGDPTGTGEGGPGYEYGNENLPKAGKSGEFTYTPGTVAMANTGEPDSNGSQFFLVYKNSPLPPDYTPFGTITSGLNIIQTVAKAGSTPKGDGHPKKKVQIESVTISKT
jgi:peptidyl-prolyl cis-trans isomerase B (cyclophilin B)